MDAAAFALVGGLLLLRLFLIWRFRKTSRVQTLTIASLQLFMVILAVIYYDRLGQNYFWVIALGAIIAIVLLGCIPSLTAVR